MNFKIFLPYLLVMAIVTYLIRAIPLVLVKHKIKNKFFNSFLYYIPYTVLAAMTIPAIFTATGSLISAIAGLAVAIMLAYQRKSLIVEVADNVLWHLLFIFITIFTTVILTEITFENIQKVRFILECV